MTHVCCFQLCCKVDTTLSNILEISWKCHFWIAKNILQLKVMFSTINDSWKIVANIVEKWGFSPSVTKLSQIKLCDDILAKFGWNSSLGRKNGTKCKGNKKLTTFYSKLHWGIKSFQNILKKILATMWELCTFNQFYFICSLWTMSLGFYHCWINIPHTLGGQLKCYFPSQYLLIYWHYQQIENFITLSKTLNWLQILKVIVM